jgi:hypothetical protein
MATPAAASRRRGGRARDIAWLVVAAILGLLFVLTITDGVVAVVLGHWADVAGLPITLLLSGWGAGGAWRRTSWGAEQRAGTARRRLIDVRGFMLFLPNGYESYARRDDTDVVIALRSVIVMITLVLGSFGSTLATVMAASNGAVLPWIGLIAALAIASFASCTFITTRPLDCTSDASLAAGYVSSVCLQITFATSLALFSFTFAFIGNAAWIYGAGAAIALLWLWSRIAPTGRTIARDQRRTSGQGCPRSLVTALRVKSA